jgi:dTDP-6-deoxy-L-talose 4-dehydrogenase (NAD+)
MRVLVTGATGFIGNYVVQELLNQGHEVIATSKNGDKAVLFDWFPKVHYIPYDLNSNRENMFQIFSEPDVVIHLAWEGLPNYNDVTFCERNLLTNYRFLKNLLDYGLKSLTVIGTCQEYGLRNGCLSEDTSTEPDTSYGLAKDTLRKFLEQLQHEYGFSFKWLRLFYVYGKGQHPSSLLSQLDDALDRGDEIFTMSGGEQLRDYLPVEQVAKYITKIALQNEVLGVINCCSGKPISVRKLVENHMKKRGKTIKLNLGFFPYSDYEPMAFWGDNTKLKRVIK